MVNRNPRKIYIRKKEKTFIFECKIKGKTTFIWTIPKDPETFLLKLCKSSFFPKDKSYRIRTLLSSSDYKDINVSNRPPKVRPIKIIGTQEKDDLDLDDEIDELAERL